MVSFSYCLPKGNHMTISFLAPAPAPEWAGFDDHLEECLCQWCDPEFNLELHADLQAVFEEAFELEPPF
jgi:hypothetical protein